MRPAEETVVVLTGASGFVGSAVLAALRRAGLRVRVLASGAGPVLPDGADVLPLPPPQAPPAAFRDALRGAHHLVHAGARNNADNRLGDAAFEAPNVVLSAKLAEAAATVLPGRSVFLSSIRAAVGPLWSGVLTDETAEAPTCPYGRSKRRGELAFLAAFAGTPGRLGILRLVPVYGPGMRGNLGALLRLADSPWPLPLASLPGRRSLLGLDAAAAAVLHLLVAPDLPPFPVLASDAAPASLPEIVAAFRRGLGRPRRLFPVPPWLFGRAADLAGKADAWRALGASQVCRPARLVESGWTPPAESLAGLAAAAAASDRHRPAHRGA